MKNFHDYLQIIQESSPSLINSAATGLYNEIVEKAGKDKMKGFANWQNIRDGLYDNEDLKDKYKLTSSAEVELVIEAIDKMFE
jgi:hypothetical protein